MSVEQLEKYYLFAQAVPPQELADGVEIKGARIPVEGYAEAFFVVNMGDVTADEIVFQIANSGIGQVGWTQRAATSGWSTDNGAVGIAVDFLALAISGYVRCEVTAIGDVALVGVSAELFGRTGKLPDDNQITVVTL